MDCVRHVIIMMMSDSNSHIPVRIIGYLSNKLMYINNNILVTFTYPFQNVGNEGSGHWRQLQYKCTFIINPHE